MLSAEHCFRRDVVALHCRDKSNQGSVEKAVAIQAMERALTQPDALTKSQVQKFSESSRVSEIVE
jgi:hypothetical protein